MGLDAMILVFLMLSFEPAFSLSSFTLICIPTEKQLHCPNILQFILPCSTIYRARSLHGIKSVDVINKIKKDSVAHMKPCGSLLVSARKSAHYSDNK